MMFRVIPSRIALILTISCVLILSACRGDAKSAIVGKWRDVSSDETIQFSADGKVIVRGKIIQAGDFSFPDSTHIEFDFNGLGVLADPVVMEYAMSSDTLKFTSSIGKAVVYKRIQ
jgi:hypothetical protein